MNDVPPYGLLVRDPLPEQAVYNRIFAGGLGTGESFNWKTFLPPRERQYRVPFCVTFSRTNCAEAKGRKEGVELNFSDRELGVISGTTRDGNFIDTVSDTFRKVGAVGEADCPFTDEMLHLTTPEAWNKIYQLPDLKGKQRYRGGGHSWVYGKAAMIDALSHSPLQIAVGLGSTWETAGIVKKPSVFTSYHAITLYYIDQHGYMYVHDSIGRELKTLEPGYPLTGVLSFRDLPEDWKDTMSQIIFVRRAGTDEYGFLERTAHTEIYHKAVTPEHLLVQAEVFGVTITSPDGKIDFSKSREISL